jgi:hypothetical protein
VDEYCLIEVRLKADALEIPSVAELELLISVLPELVLLMQKQDEAED